MSMAEEQYYAGPRAAPHGLLVAVVLGLLIAWPLFLQGDGGEAFTDTIAELLGPVGLLLLPVGLLIIISLLSSDRGPHMLAFGGSPDTVHHVGGSPIGVALMLALILALLYYRYALFGGGGDEDE
ncbi:uncharacterized protein LOC123431278 [Hordeum vulgare subsp. vulgare]|uniref:uncharacterized protein LOC123431278 n=1 Tax=Hordeum vulgare subsp. vulgare TaxID=112509 RepID=UPI001D1A3AA2|nr:uncharacterized protein LOC123431278 [Hordeum vulgare subsp. vulgare]